MALQLRKYGIRNVRPLLGGFLEWRRLGFPLIEIADLDEGPMDGSSRIAAEGPA